MLQPDRHRPVFELLRACALTVALATVPVVLIVAGHAASAFAQVDTDDDGIPDAQDECPGNEQPGTPCGDPTTTPCTQPDTCDGAGECLPNHAVAGTVCRGLAGDCLADGTGCLETIDFEGFTAGAMISKVFASNGSGPIGIDAANPLLGSGVNAAVVYDSTCSGECSGNDSDLGAPNEGYGGPGFGVGGAPGGMAPNAHALGNVLIVAEDLSDVDVDGNVDLPDDQNDQAVTMTFDFSSIGPVLVTSLTVIDADLDEPQPQVDLLDAGGAVLESFTLPHTDDNGVLAVDLPSSSAASAMVVRFGGSGAVASVSFRGPTTSCDVVEHCDVVSGECPADALADAGTECRAGNGVCDQADQCTGASAFCPADAKTTSMCRAAAGDCDVAEMCDGMSNACGADAYADSTVLCRAAAGACDAAEFCDGLAASCAADAKSTSMCRPAAGACDEAEICDGVGDECPTDEKRSGVCRTSAGECDVEDVCDGVSDECPADEKSTTMCRSAAGPCDEAEFCDGAADDCPTDAKSTGLCRQAAGACDLDDFCDGVADECPADEKSTGVCRTSGGECDVEDVCDGVSDECPADEKSTAVCRDAEGVCDLAESCDGVGDDCPADLKSSAECRAASGECDVAETCDGAADDCPADAFEPSGLACGDDANPCTDDACDGAGVCAHADNMEPCDDGDACTVDDVCSAGACAGTLVAPDHCDDGNECTFDSCDAQGGCMNVAEPVEPTLCATSGIANLRVREGLRPKRNRLKWRWARGSAVTQIELGAPRVETGHALCVFDTQGSETRLAASLHVEPNTDWQSRGFRGWEYKDRSAARAGVKKMKLRPGGDGRTQVQLKARGTALPLPSPMSDTRYFQQDAGVIVQMLNSDGMCWTSEFDTYTRNSGRQFKAKAKTQ